jgi:hypothetical protein
VSYGIRAIDRSCGSYAPGHQVHWIQGLRSAGATVVIPVSVAVHPSGLVQLRAGVSLECWNHTPAAIQASLPRNSDHAVVWWLPEWHVLSFSAHGGGSFSLAAFDDRTPCHPGARQAPGESASEFVARATREDHGFTVPGRSLFAPDGVEDRGNNERDVDRIKEKDRWLWTITECLPVPTYCPQLAHRYRHLQRSPVMNFRC